MPKTNTVQKFVSAPLDPMKFESFNDYKVEFSKKVSNSFLRKEGNTLEIYSKSPIQKKRIYFYASCKHTYVCHIGKSASGGWNKSLIFGTPSRNNFVVNVGVHLISNCYNRLTQERINYDKKAESIVFKILIKNIISVNEVQFTKEVEINGSTTGKDLRTIIANECNFYEIHSLKYSLNLFIRNRLIPLRNDVSLLMLYEHAIYSDHDFRCTKKCIYLSKVPSKTLEIYIKQDKDFVNNEFTEYSLKKNWKNNKIPNWLMRLMSDLYYNGSKVQGIFRENGTSSSIRKWMSHIINKKNFVIHDSIIVKGSVFKSFIRNIEGALLRRRFVLRHFYSILGDFLEPEYFQIEKHKASLVRNLNRIPRRNLLLLKNLLVILSGIIENSSDKNIKYNLSVLFSQNLFAAGAFSLTSDSLKATEIIISFADDLVTPSEKREILENFEKFRADSEIENNDDNHISNSHLISNALQYDSASYDNNEICNSVEVSSNDEESCKSIEISSSDEESFQSDDSSLSDEESIQSDNLSLSDDESFKSTEISLHNEESCKSADIMLDNEESCKSADITLHIEESCKSADITLHIEESCNSTDIMLDNEESGKSANLHNNESFKSTVIMLDNEEFCKSADMSLNNEKSFNSNDLSDNIHEYCDNLESNCDLENAMNAENEHFKNSIVDETSPPLPKRIRKSLADIIPNNRGFQQENVRILIQRFESQTNKK